MKRAFARISNISLPPLRHRLILVSDPSLEKASQQAIDRTYEDSRPVHVHSWGLDRRNGGAGRRAFDFHLPDHFFNVEFIKKEWRRV